MKYCQWHPMFKACTMMSWYHLGVHDIEVHHVGQVCPLNIGNAVFMRPKTSFLPTQHIYTFTGSICSCLNICLLLYEKLQLYTALSFSLFRLTTQCIFFTLGCSVLISRSAFSLIILSHVSVIVFIPVLSNVFSLIKTFK